MSLFFHYKVFSDGARISYPLSARYVTWDDQDDMKDWMNEWMNAGESEGGGRAEGWMTKCAKEPGIAHKILM